MSGGDGFYKFRCKNFITYDCKNWVWVNHSACAACVAAGRDDEHIMDNTLPFEIVDPFVESGGPVNEVVEFGEGLSGEDYGSGSWGMAAHEHPCRQH